MEDGSGVSGDGSHGTAGAITNELTALDEEYDQLNQFHEAAEAAGSEGQATDADVERRSVYVGNVDYSATPENVHEHFKACGPIRRITILVNHLTGKPKGYAFVEFGTEEAVSHALLLDGTVLHDRQIKVSACVCARAQVLAKRKNVPGLGRDRGFRGRWRGGRRGVGRWIKGMRGRG